MLVHQYCLSLMMYTMCFKKNWFRSKIYIFVPAGKTSIAMTNSRTFFVIGLAAVMLLSAAFAFLPVAEGHGVQAQLQSRFVKISDESFSAQTVHTGDTITVKGTLQSLVNRPLRAWLSLFSESTNAGNRWEFIARDPPGNIFDIPPQGTIPYSITAKALEPGIYHVHTQLNIEHIGPGLGPGQTVQVTGEPIYKPVPWGNVVYQCILIGAGLGITFATRPWQVI
jgi:methane/ammonia monooxygenase subunit B